MDSVTVTDGYIGYTETEIHGFTTVSFMEGGKIAQPVNSLSSICIVFCFVLYKLKKAGPLKSDIRLLA